MMKVNKKFFNIILFPFFLLSFLFFFSFFFSQDSYAQCYSHWCCGSVGYRGCVWDNWSGARRCNCQGSNLYCDPGPCGDCTPSCPSGYTSSNTGCRTTTAYCTRTYQCMGGSCGSRSRTCYLVRHRVSYDGNGGSCSPSYRDVCRGSTSAAPSCSRSGYKLTGFSRTSGSGGTLNTSTGAVRNVTGAQTIRANWVLACSCGSWSNAGCGTGVCGATQMRQTRSCTPSRCASQSRCVSHSSCVQYSVTYDGNSGSCSPTPQVVYTGSNTQQPSCSRTGHTLASFTRTWGSGGSLNTSTGVVSNVTGDQTIRANWNINTYTVSYNANGGSCPSDQTVNYGGSNTAPNCTRTGYTRTGYTITSGSCAGTFNSSTGVCNNVRANMTIRANWAINTYVVNYDGNTGSCSPTPQTINHGSNTQQPSCNRFCYSLSSPAFTRTWGSGGSLNTSTGVVSNVTGDQTIRANWDINTYTVSYNANGGSCLVYSPSSRNVNCGSSASGPSCSRTGYTLTGYTITGGSCAGTFNSSTGSCSNVQANITIRANWVLNSYTVTYNGNGGSCSPTPQIINHGGSTQTVSCNRYNHYLTGFTITGGSCAGSFNSSTGYCSNVQTNMTIRANWFDCGACANCNPCTFPGCPDYYTCSNTGCSTTTISCTRYNLCEPCGSTSATCYLVRHQVNFFASEGGSILGPSSQSVCRGSNSDFVNAMPGEGYYFTQWSDGEVNPERRVTHVLNNETRTANFLECPGPTCSSLASKVTWSDSCVTEEDCRIAENKEMPIASPDANCPDSGVRDCYRDNPRPESPEQGVNNLELSFSSPNENVLGFESLTHTGRELNNALDIKIEYQDEDGSEDIEALYMWFAHDSFENKDFVTPQRIASSSEGLEGLLDNNGSLGFMIRRDFSTGVWEKVYIPHISSETEAWVEAGNITDSSIEVNGSSGKRIAQLSDIVILEDDEIVELSYRILFERDTTDLREAVLNGEYGVWSKANDVTGFLPFYGEDIKDFADEFWVYSGSSRFLDMRTPEIETFTVTDIDQGIVSISLSVNESGDSFGLSNIRVDACRNDGTQFSPLNSSELEGSYLLVNCSSFGLRSVAQEDSLLGTRGTLDPNTSSETITFEVGLNDGEEINEGGTITFRLFVMDNAGNHIHRDEIYRLGDWVVVKEGLVFGAQGVSSSTRNIGGEVTWSDPLAKYGFVGNISDLTNQVLLGGHNSTNSFLGLLERTTTNSSFKVSRFPGIHVTSVFNELVISYTERKNKGLLYNYEEIEASDNISTPLSQICTGIDTKYCIINSNDDLVITSGFDCDGNGLIISKGDITLHPDIENVSFSDGCIFLSAGDIIIEKGLDKVSSNVGYDILDAFLIAVGEVRIEEDSNNDGLLLEGGMLAFTKKDGYGSIHNKRSVLADYRNVYPVLAIKGGSKYGLLAGELFGTQVDLFRYEMGFKPY